jgi:CheY-like chemotaxis protein
MPRIVLGDRAASVRPASSAEEAIDRIGQNPPDLRVSDIGMPGTDGDEPLRHIRSGTAVAEAAPCRRSRSRRSHATKVVNRRRSRASTSIAPSPCIR